MTTASSPTVQSFNKTLLMKRMIIGAGIALVLMALLIVPIRNPKPEWGQLWMLRPFIVITFAGATGAAIFHFLEQKSPAGWKKITAYALSFIIYLFGLWIGTILGLSGTLWN